VYFGLSFLKTPSSDFGIFSPIEVCPSTLMIPKIWTKSDKRNLKKFVQIWYPKYELLRFGPLLHCSLRRMRSVFGVVGQLRMAVSPHVECPRSDCPDRLQSRQVWRSIQHHIVTPYWSFCISCIFRHSLNIYSWPSLEGARWQSAHSYLTCLPRASHTSHTPTNSPPLCASTLDRYMVSALRSRVGWAFASWSVQL